MVGRAVEAHWTSEKSISDGVDFSKGIPALESHFSMAVISELAPQSCQRAVKIGQRFYNFMNLQSISIGKTFKG